MAATDQTYRNQKALDVVFGASCVLLLLVTVLMMWLDHDLPWKANQRTFRDVVPAIREREMVEKLPDGEVVYEKRLVVSAARDRLAQGKKLVATRDRELTAERELQTMKVQGIKADYDALVTYYNIDAEHWGKAAPDSKEKERLKVAVDEKKGRLDKLEKDLQTSQSKLDAINAQYAEEVLDTPLELEPEAAYPSSPTSNGQANGTAKADANLPTVRKLDAALANSEDDLKKITGNFDRFAKGTVQTAWRFGDTFRALPILDGFESPVKIKQIWLPDLMIEYGSFRDVPRYDRCTTCHLGIDQPAFDRGTLQKLADVPEHAEIDRLVRDLDARNRELTDLYTGGDLGNLIKVLGAIENLLEPELARQAFLGLRMQVSYAKSKWEEHRKGKKGPIQLASDLDLLVRTLETMRGKLLTTRAALAEGRTPSGVNAKALADATAKLEGQWGEAVLLVGYYNDGVAASLKSVKDANVQSSANDDAALKARGQKVKAVLGALKAPALESVVKLQAAGDMLKERQASGEKLGFDPDDLPTRTLSSSSTMVFWVVLSAGVLLAGAAGWLRKSAKLGAAVGLVAVLVSVGSAAYVGTRAPKVYATRTVKLNEAQVAMFATHPRLDLFVDGNSPHSAEKFGCTICHGGQGSATDFQLSSHVPNDTSQKEKWEKDHNWQPSHHWDYPMLQKRFLESTCVKCHHQMTDLVRDGNKEEAPKLLRGYNLVKENGCFGCHEISGVKGGRSIGPDLRLEPGPALQYLSAGEQEKAKANPMNLPGAMRKVGPGLRRLAEKTNQDWTRKWVDSPRSFRPDTKMPHFYHLSNNNQEALEGTGQEKFPATEVHAIAHYLFAESKGNLKGEDTYRKALIDNLSSLQKKLLLAPLAIRDEKELHDVARKLADLALLSVPESHGTINDAARRMREAQEQLQELHRTHARFARSAPSDADKGERKWVSDTLAEAKRALESATADLRKAGAPTPISARLVNEDGREIALPPVAKDLEASHKRGRQLFTEKGCLACHAHEGTTKKGDGFPAVVSQANHGPELSRIAAKIRPEVGASEGRRWLIQWILNPNVYHPRTRMPITYLSPADAADVAFWLLTQGLTESERQVQALLPTYVLDWLPLQMMTDWNVKGPAAPTRKDLVQLARVYLIKAPGMTTAKLNDMFPEDGELKGLPVEELTHLARDADERRLAKKKISDDDLKWYVGRKAVGRQGCYACHDVPGFETAKPIGVALNDWGKKDPERLAFEDAAIWVKDHFTIVDGRNTRQGVERRVRDLILRGGRALPAADQAKLRTLLSGSDEGGRAELLELGARAEASLTPAERRDLGELRMQLSVQPRIRELEAKGDKALGAHERRELAELRKLKLWDEATGPRTPYEASFYHALEHHTREGFLFNKLLEPRSYDYNRLKTWDDRLRMPQFRFARSRRHANESAAEHRTRQEAEEAEAREAVMTFILGLVAEPIPEKYLPKPNPDKQAEVRGRQVLDQFNCGGCHQVRPGTYEFKNTPAMQKVLQDAYVAEINSERYKGDMPFPGHNAWTGVAQTGATLAASGVPTRVDSEYVGPPVRPVRLHEALRFQGADKVARDIPAATEIYLPQNALVRETQPYGGGLIDTLLPHLTAKGDTVARAKYGRTRFDDADNARGALPPPLYREGERVQPDWLYRFLLNPMPIRPTSPDNGIILRMPRFNMSPEESRALVNYFAAVSKVNNPGAGITYPYATTRPSEEYWRERSVEYTKNLARLKHLEPPAKLVTLRKKAAPSAEEQKELETLAKAYSDETSRFDGLQNKSQRQGLSEEEKADLEKLTKRSKGSKLGARLAELRPIWETMAQQDVKDATAALKEARKEAAAAKKSKAADLTTKEQAVKEAEQKLADAKKNTGKRVTDLRQEWETRRSYPEAALRVVTSPSVCLSCHSVGKLKNLGEKGPNLEMAADRLRPEWMEWWIGHPERMFPYKPIMIQNFKNDPDPTKWAWQDLFAGSPREQTRATRDVLLDLRRWSDLMDKRPTVPAAEGEP